MAQVIDDFRKYPHSKTLLPGAPTDTCSTPARETVFTTGGGTAWDHGNGIHSIRGKELSCDQL